MGLTDRTLSQPAAYGVTLPPDRRRMLAGATGLSDAVISPLLLSRYSPAVLPWDTLDLTRPAAIRQWARSAWVFVWPSHACPECVRESGGVWKLRWKLPWSFVCPLHRRYLLASCQACGTRLQSNVLDHRQQLVCCASAPDLIRPRFDGRARVRRHPDDICGAEVGDFTSASASSEAMELQSRIDALVEGTDQVADAHTHSLDEIRRLATFALYLGVPELLPDADPAVRDRFAEHVDERDVALARRGGRAAAKDRQYSLPIVDPLLAAGAMTVGGRLAFADDVEAIWGQVMDVVFDNLPNAATQWTQLNKFWTAPTRHASALERARIRSMYVVSSLDGRSRSLRPAHADLDARHVPALLWPNAYRFLADEVMEHGWAVDGRRFAAIAFARHLQPDLGDWKAAARALDLDPRCTANAHRWMGRFRREGTGRILEQRLDVLAEELALTSKRVDYRQRREVLAHFDEVAPADWASICTASGVDAEQHWWSLRRPQAAAWLWETLTGGDWHHAPSLGLAARPPEERRVVANAYVSYFKANHLPKVETALAEFAATLLRRHHLAGPVSLDLDPTSRAE